MVGDFSGNSNLVGDRSPITPTVVQPLVWPSRHTANRRRPGWPLHYSTWFAYLMQHRPFLARLVFSN